MQMTLKIVMTQNALIHARPDRQSLLLRALSLSLSLSIFLSFPLTHILFLFSYSLFLSFLGCKDLTRIIRSSRLILKKHDD